MSEGTIFKAEKDFTKDVDKLIPEAQELAKVWDICTALRIPCSPVFPDRPMCTPQSTSCWLSRSRPDRYNLRLLCICPNSILINIIDSPPTCLPRLDGLSPSL